MKKKRTNTPTDHRARLLLYIWVPLVREVFKLVIIGSYLIFALWLILFQGSPLGFLPLLPWALRSVARGR